MTEPLYYVVIRAARKRTGRRRKSLIVKRMGPFSYTEACAVREGAAINLDHASFSVQVNEDRTAYWAEYHKKRYRKRRIRERMKKTARNHARKARASARGDMTPWLSQD